MTLLVISPHLDDAVFSCGIKLAATPGALVCTVFAGTPHEALVTDWDRQCGFDDAHQAMRARRKEDNAALDVLGARSLHLGFLDAQYAAGEHIPSSEDIAREIKKLIEKFTPDTLYIPLGLFHSDHALTYEACLDAWLPDTSPTCVAYEEALYRRMEGLAQTRLAELKERGIIATPLLPALDPQALAHGLEQKRAAVSRYTSQLEAFGTNGYDDVFAAERAWSLQRQGAGLVDA
jgi:LmbE family N-acetylglucosaminyl deacetylase